MMEGRKEKHNNNNNVGPENRTANGRETKDEVDRRLQKDSRDTVVNTS